MSDLVLVEHGAGFRTLSLNRPDKLNAFDDALHAALTAALLDADADPACRALVLTGAGRGFSAGADLASTQGQDLGTVLETTFNPLIRKIRGLRMPVVCAVNGVAAGAGANVALACDIVLAGRTARFIQAFIKIGLVPDAGGTWLLPRLAGDARARGMAMLGGPVTAEQALAWGMIWQVTEDETLVAQAQALAAQLATQPTAALATMKRMFATSGTNTLDQQLDLERDMQRQAGRGPDFAEGVAAFMEKRPPKFNGRDA
ncbi:2-(1,2-epoxy-1,2-dihydrophenyl)acetyl-CoA isomerase PaaG [Acidisphaera sp. L21]|uniref:2-(1,2-epoxy-1,2-dihydrophenyl)acetyl-CoA isomerase PaaG n=1 Tax=Acidisphaera sp. L21 TaxID=1641851 RepID=UPI00131BF4B1|nr:2-(1,2-epoxy-1,2-dihydrophenyl)acetyl-CoA isomerase PaaG [Acidisphaera sp. L21]